MSKFIEAAKENASHIKAYKPLSDGSDGTCDCVGLITGAKIMAGGKWNGPHGCNYAARREMNSLQQICSEDDFFPGEVIYKARQPEDDGYELPTRYRRHGTDYNGDLTDYFHMGLVVDINPLTIIHCTTLNPVATDHEKRRWAYGGTLKGVDYEEIGIANCPQRRMMVIVSDNFRHTALMREKANGASKVICEIPGGTPVEIVEVGGQWTHVRYNGHDGHIANKHLGLHTVRIDHKMK